MDTLKIVKISQAQATQRTGRVGRESEGICFRTYTKDEFENMEPNTVPEILRCNITATVSLNGFFVFFINVAINSIYFDL